MFEYLVTLAEISDQGKHVGKLLRSLSSERTQKWVAARAIDYRRDVTNAGSFEKSKVGFHQVEIEPPVSFPYR